MKEEKNNTLFIIALIGILVFVFWPTIKQTVTPLMDPARELTITIVNEASQVQSVMVQPPAIQPQPVQQVQPAFTPGQLADCAYSQAAGLPSAGCPENAGEILGVGR
jgi:hypothetical protein